MRPSVMQWRPLSRGVARRGGGGEGGWGARGCFHVHRHYERCRVNSMNARCSGVHLMGTPSEISARKFEACTDVELSLLLMEEVMTCFADDHLKLISIGRHGVLQNSRGCHRDITSSIHQKPVQDFLASIREDHGQFVHSLGRRSEALESQRSVDLFGTAAHRAKSD